VTRRRKKRHPATPEEVAAYCDELMAFMDSLPQEKAAKLVRDACAKLGIDPLQELLNVLKRGEFPDECKPQMFETLERVFGRRTA
jgi:hypothetical protein